MIAAEGSRGGSSGANVVSTEGAAEAAPVEDDDPEASVWGALAWIGLHARAATVAEEALAVEIAERDAKVLLLLSISRDECWCCLFVFHVENRSCSSHCPLRRTSTFKPARRKTTAGEVSIDR